MKNTIFYIIFFIGIQFTSTAQCFPDRHNTTWFDAWISCDVATSPNPVRGKTHWIMYDLGRKYIIKDMHLWNLNVPGRLDQGVRRFAIDISDNGTDWVDAGTYSLDRSDARSTYEGSDIEDFVMTSGQFVLLTVLETWGGDCAGFSELRMHVEPKIVTTATTEAELHCSPKQKGIHLEWAKLSPEEELHLEKSEDGMKWHPADATPTLLSNGKYSWTDKEQERGFYRIKRISGPSVSYSKAHYCSRAELSLEVWPNPIRNIGYIKIGSNSDEPIICSVEDLLGRSHLHKIIKSKEPIHTLDIGKLHLPSGTYTVTVEQGKKLRSVKLIKI